MIWMEDGACDAGALAETVVFLSHFDELPDDRQAAKVRYPLDEVLLLCLRAVLAGAETITDIARFGEKKLDLLRRFRPFAAGTPAHDHLGDILATLDAEQFQRCFVAWTVSLIGVPEGVVAIDGKTSRRSKGAAKEAIHMVSPFAPRHRLGLGQAKLATKPTQSPPLPHDIGRLEEPPQGPGLASGVMVESPRESGDKIDREPRFYITSLALQAAHVAAFVRAHWAVENSLHWVMDMVFRDDECRLRTDNAPANFTTIKHIALNLIRRAKSKDSVRLRRKVAAWDDEFLASLIIA